MQEGRRRSRRGETKQEGRRRSRRGDEVGARLWCRMRRIWGGKEGDKTGGVTKWERDGGAEWLRW